MLDDAHREPQAVVDGPHPLRVALGQVVVDGDDVDASAGHGVERRRQGRHEGLALAGLHLGDLALVEHDAAHELDVEVAHAQLAPADLAGRREDVRQDLVEGLLEALAVLSVTLPSQVGAPLAVRGLALLLRRVRRRCVLADLVADIGHLGPDLLVGEGLVVRLELVDADHDGPQPVEVGVVAAADEATEDAAHGSQKYRLPCPGTRAHHREGGRSACLWGAPLCVARMGGYTRAKRRRPPSGVVRARPSRGVSGRGIVGRGREP